MGKSEEKQVQLLGKDKDFLQFLTGTFELDVDFEGRRLLLHRHISNEMTGNMLLVPGGGDPSLPVLDSDCIRQIVVDEEGDAIEMKIEGDLTWAEYTLLIRFPRRSPGLIISQIFIRLTRDIGAADQLFSGLHYELAYNVDNPYFRPSMTYYFNGTPGAQTYHTVDDRGAIADLNQFIFFGDPHVLDATVFIYTDFTSLSPFYEVTGTSMFETVRQPPGCLRTAANTYMAQPFLFGYDIPGIKMPLKNGAEFLATNSLLYLQGGSPEIDQPIEYSKRFILASSEVFSYIEKPDAAYVDWPAIVEKGIESLADYENTSDARSVILHQTNLNSIARYGRAFFSEAAERLVSDADKLVDAFSPKLPYGDAWQYLFPIIMVGEYAKDFQSDVARKKFLSLADDVISIGTKLGYVFPLRILDDFSKEEIIRYEYDCTGAFVYLMLLYFEFTDDEIYLSEARNAADLLIDMGFEFPYEFTTTSLAPVALVRLSKLTGDHRFLEASYIPLAAIVRHSWFFNPGYREYKGRTIFLLTEGMPGVYANGWEEASLLRYLFLYLSETFELIMPQAIYLISEILRRKCMSLTDSLAPMLPDPSIIYDGVPREWHMPVNPEWYIPLEGFGYLEWDKSGLHDRPGRVSQPPYCFGALPEAALIQFHPLSNEVMLYAEMPAIVEKIEDAGSNPEFRLKVLAKTGSCSVLLFGGRGIRPEVYELVNEGAEQIPVSFDKKAGRHVFLIQPDCSYRLVLR